MARPTTVDEYLAGVPEGQRNALEQLRRVIRQAAPEAVETIAYNMPAYRHGGKFLVSFSAFRDHCSLFPASQAVREALADELSSNLSGKGTIRFATDDPLSAEVVRKIVEVRLEELAGSGREGRA